MQLTRRVTMAEVESLQACCCLQNQAVGPSTSGRVGFEPYGAEVVPWSQADVRVESGGQPPEQGDGGLGAALFDALDFIGGHVSPAGQVGDAEAYYGSDRSLAGRGRDGNCRLGWPLPGWAYWW